MNAVARMVARSLVAVLTLAAFSVTASSQAVTYSENPRISAVLDSSRRCAGDNLTHYDVTLTNNTRRARYFRAFVVQRGVKISDDRYRVPRRTNTGLLFYVPAGQRFAVTVVHRGEVILHRRLTGICY